jgi:hypothetical protein
MLSPNNFTEIIQTFVENNKTQTEIFLIFSVVLSRSLGVVFPVPVLPVVFIAPLVRAGRPLGRVQELIQTEWIIFIALKLNRTCNKQKDISF